jgi:hypothetical protein
MPDVTSFGPVRRVEVIFTEPADGEGEFDVSIVLNAPVHPDWVKLWHRPVSGMGGARDFTTQVPALQSPGLLRRNCRNKAHGDAFIAFIDKRIRRVNELFEASMVAAERAG